MYMTTVLVPLIYLRPVITELDQVLTSNVMVDNSIPRRCAAAATSLWSWVDVALVYNRGCKAARYQPACYVNSCWKPRRDARSGPLRRWVIGVVRSCRRPVRVDDAYSPRQHHVEVIAPRIKSHRFGECHRIGRLIQVSNQVLAWLQVSVRSKSPCQAVP